MLGLESMPIAISGAIRAFEYLMYGGNGHNQRDANRKFPKMPACHRRDGSLPDCCGAGDVTMRAMVFGLAGIFRVVGKHGLPGISIVHSEIREHPERPGLLDRSRFPSRSDVDGAAGGSHGNVTSREDADLPGGGQAGSRHDSDVESK